jgi:hypothetical protein
MQKSVQVTYTIQSVSYKWMHGLSGLSEDIAHIKIIKVPVRERDVVNPLSGIKSAAVNNMK